MLLRHRSPGIQSQPGRTTKGLEHLTDEWVAVLRWLKANQVEHVLIGAAGQAIRDDTAARGPVAIVPAPYGRNLERLARALLSVHARLRIDGEGETAPVRMTPEKLARGTHWTLRCGVHDLDIERGTAGGAAARAGVPRYEELLYDASRFELEPQLSIEVASPEHLERFAHLRRTGTVPEIRISRRSEAGDERGRAR